MVSNHDHHHHHQDDCCHDSKEIKQEPQHIPRRKILTLHDLERFQSSEALSKYIGFITRLNDKIANQTLSSARGKYYSSVGPENGATDGIISKLISLLETLSKWVDEIEPHQVGLSRFGNPAFRTWFDKVSEEMDTLLMPIFSNKLQREEAGTYLSAAFGDRKRIDYGTGHEANFMCFLLCCQEFLKLDQDQVYEEFVAVTFWDYILLMRKLQLNYWLEPAGSHGVWGLDDYQFLPFLFGSGQLMDHKHLRPKSIHDKEVLEEVSKDYMYFSCVNHVNSIKSESLTWHSPMLNDISGVKKWSKVNEGMFKMYRQEVLNKLPIMQHFLFGTVLQFEGSEDSLINQVLDSEFGHVHALGQERPLCCTIRVPSSIAASRATANTQRRLPFD